MFFVFGSIKSSYTLALVFWKILMLAFTQFGNHDSLKMPFSPNRLNTDIIILLIKGLSRLTK